MAAKDRSGWSLVEEASRQGLIDPRVVELARQSPDVTLTMALESVGGEAVRQGNDRMAERLYRAALEAGSRLPGVPYNLGNIATRGGRHREAVRCYTQAIELDPGMGPAYYNRGLRLRELGDESSARRDIAAGIERGYDGIEAHAALLRGRAREYGEPVEALERAVVARQALAAGDRDTALMLADLEVRALRDAGKANLRGKVAFVIALENACYVCDHVGDTDGAVAAGSELVTLCGQLADLEDSAWATVPRELRVFTVERLPQRLIDMIGRYARIGRHADALLAAEQAQARCGEGSRDPRLHALYDELSGAVYLELGRRALAAVQDED